MMSPDRMVHFIWKAAGFLGKLRIIGIRATSRSGPDAQALP
jgi:hypothetical protein